MLDAKPDEIVLEVQGRRFDALSLGAHTGDLVLLLHGFPQFADSWLPVMRLLAHGGYRAVAVDQRGYSPGARPEEIDQYRLDRLVGDVLGFADALGAARFHLVGHDWGGLLAWQFAADHPGRLRSVTVLATPHISAFSEAIRGDRNQRYKSKYILLFKAPGHVAEALLLAFGASLLRRVYQGRIPAEQVEANVQRLSRKGALTAALNWYRALSPSARAGRVTVPALYIWGDQDIALGETAALGTARYIDGPYRFERVVGGSHWLVEEAPERMAALILERMAHNQAG